MTVFRSKIATGSDTFRQNREAMLDLVTKLREYEGRAEQLSEKRRPRFEERGQLTPRERLARLLDPGMPFLELYNLCNFLVDDPDPDTSVPGGNMITGIGFVGLSAVAWVTRRDLSFIRPLIMWGGVAALVLIVGAVLFGFNLGTWFSVAMIGLAGAAILYTTQQALRTYPEQAYVAAAVQLFASIMTMFWYVLRIFADR